MIETDFGWALAKMRDGYRVRRKGWSAGRYLSMPEDHSAILVARGGDTRTLVDISAESALAYDWELAE